MGRQIAQGIISRIDEMKKCIPTNSSTLPLIIISEVAAFNNLANISFAECTMEGANEARKHYEMCQILCASIGINEKDSIMQFAKDGLASVEYFLNTVNATIPNDIIGKLNQLSIISNGSNREVDLDDDSVKNIPKKRQKVEIQKTVADPMELDTRQREQFGTPSNDNSASIESSSSSTSPSQGDDDVVMEDELRVRRTGRKREKPMVTTYAVKGNPTEGNPTDLVMEYDIENESTQTVEVEDDDIVESDNGMLLDDQGVNSLQQSLPTYLRNTHTTLSKYNTTKTPQNTSITEKSNKMIDSFEISKHNGINALGLSTEELESFAILTQLDITNKTTSGSLFDAFQTQYGAGGETRRPGRVILPKLKAKSYENVKRYKLSPIWDKSDCTVNVRTILIKGLNNGDSASSITKAIKDGFNQFNWEIFSFSSCPIREQQSNENDTLAPMVATLARGSSGTDNCLTSQITKCTTTSYLLVETGILPPHTELVQQVFAAYNIDRDELCDAQAVSSLISFLLKTPREQLVYLSVNEILRIGLPPKDVVTLVLVFINIHPNIKLLSASELCMPFLGVVLRNYEFYQGQKLINQVLGWQKAPGGVRVGYLDSELQYTLDAEITIDNEYQFLTNGSKTTITKLASLLLPHWRAIEGRKDTVFQIERGIELGLSHPKANSIGGNVLTIVDEVSTNNVTDVTLTLDQQRDNIDEAMDEKIAAKLHISIGKKKYVIIYLRYTHINQSDSIFKLAAEQFTICYAAGVARKLINKETELIIIFDNGKSRDGRDDLLNPGLATAFAYICDGNVIAIICSTSIRCTSIRVLFKCLQRTCTGSKTLLITAQHSSELAGVIMEYQHGRNVANKIRYHTFDITSETLLGDLCDLAQRLSKYMNSCSQWRISPSNSLFLNEMEHAIEQQRAEKEKKTAKKACGVQISQLQERFELKKCGKCGIEKKNWSYLSDQWNKLEDNERICQVCTKAETKRGAADQQKKEKELPVIDWSSLQMSQLYNSIIVLTGEAAISANTGTSKPTGEAAAAYLSQVKDAVSHEIHDEFMDELNCYRQEDTAGLINRIRWLFTRHEISSDSYQKLMLGFNIFLPNRYKICLATEQLRQWECEQLQVEKKKRQLELEERQRKRAEKKHASVDVPSCTVDPAYGRSLVGLRLDLPSKWCGQSGEQTFDGTVVAFDPAQQNENYFIFQQDGVPEKRYAIQYDGIRLHAKREQPQTYNLPIKVPTLANIK